VLSASGTNNANYRNDNGFTGPVSYLTSVGAFAASPSAYGTFDQTGEINQWNEALIDVLYRCLRGGDAEEVSTYMPATRRDFASFPTTESNTYGFRVAGVLPVPEPGSFALLAIGAAGLLHWVRRRKASP